MKITVCDLQPVVGLAHHFRPSVEDCTYQVNVSFMIADFFKPETLPKADLYVLSRILHDWSEEKIDLILSNVFHCLPSGKKKKITTQCTHDHSWYWVAVDIINSLLVKVMTNSAILTLTSPIDECAYQKRIGPCKKKFFCFTHYSYACLPSQFPIQITLMQTFTKLISIH